MNYQKGLIADRSPDANQDNKLEDIKNRYKNLPQDLKHIIHFIALAHFIDSRTQVLKCLKTSNIKLASGKAYSPQLVTNYLKDLQKSNLIHYHDRYFCNQEIIHLVTQDAVKSEFFKDYLKVFNEFYDLSSYSFYDYSNVHKNLRLAIYENNASKIKSIFEQYSSRSKNFIENLFVNQDIKFDWLKSRPLYIQSIILKSKVNNFILHGKNIIQLENFEKHYKKLEVDKSTSLIIKALQTNKKSLPPGFTTNLNPEDDKIIKYIIHDLRVACILKGDLSSPLLISAKELRSKNAPEDFRIFLQMGLIAFITEDNQQKEYASLYFKKALSKFRKEKGKRNISFEDMYALIYMLSLLKETKHNKLNSTNDKGELSISEAITEIRKLLNLISLDENQPDYYIFVLMELLCDFLEVENINFEEELVSVHKIIQEKSSRYSNIPTVFCALLVQFYIQQSISKYLYDYYVKYFMKIKSSSPVLAEFIRQILNKIEVEKVKKRETLPISINNCNLMDITNILECKKHWERSLENVELFFHKFKNSTSTHNDSEKPNPTKRLVWKVDFEDPEIRVLEQSAKKKNGWTKGRPVALKRLYDLDLDSDLNYLTDKDKPALAGITRILNEGWYADSYEYYFDFDSTILNLIGHPNIYLYDDEQCINPIELILSYPELVTKKKSGSYNIKLSHEAEESGIFIEKDAENRYRVINFSQQIFEFQNKLGPHGINIPLSEKESIINIEKQASELLNISSDSDFVADKEGDSSPIIHLTPYEEGLKLVMKVRPFKNYGLYYDCGVGSKRVLTLKNNKQERVERKLSKEKYKASKILKKCPTLKNNEGSTNEWILLDSILCLEVLTELNNIKDDVKIEWPEGEKFSVLKELSFDSMSMKIQKKNKWFYFDGSFDFNEKTLKIKKLLDNIDDLKGRFIEIEPGQFIALTEHFKKELKKLKAVSETDKKENRIHSLGASSLENFSQNIKEVNADKYWQENLDNFTTYQRFIPKLPSTLKANLRDYQLEGFCWLSKLFKLGAGACLADDMGLGKTVQAIALMLEHTHKGAILVVAPTSVCHNWESEIKKFAPTLNVFLFSESQNRIKIVEKMSSFDILITSYGLLNTEEDLLKKKLWETIILDEAQAIKNHSAQRTKAACSLQGNFRVALSGTPIENNLGELWSLFNFINPGLLGIQSSFKKKFLIPIQQSQDEYAKQALNSLISPFILRRTKDKVLKELPPRIEKNLYVDMNNEEKNFYEALRLKSIEKLTKQDDDNNSGTRKLHILAELIKLRQAACNPMLVKEVKKNTDIIQNVSSSKMKVFLELVSGLITNNHKALVFSQFTTHLNLMRDELDKLGIKYQYLDGSTPAKSRKNNVNAFQAGGYDLFLISLKAGGSGLNLTAADYVIHLDPWWNPAVEDQASDRAHRLGQQRPVTIYRLITKNTVEEKILQLHQNKRQLTNDLLSGKNIAKTLTEKDLLNLLHPKEV